MLFSPRPGRGRLSGVLLVLALLAPVSAALAQQRPLVTEDPQTVGAGLVLIEGGFSAAKDQKFPVSGLEGNLFRTSMLGISVGLSSIAELQIDGGFYDSLAITRRGEGPLASMVTATGDRTSDAEDIYIGTKIRLVRERDRRPGFGFRFSTKIPSASNESGLGVDTADFFASVLGAKTVQSVRVVGNLGIGILGDPTEGHAQNDVLTYGVSIARAVTNRAEFVSEVNGRVSTRRGVAFPGTETRGLLTVGARYTRSALRVDAATFFGLAPPDPTIGFTVGFTYVFKAFTVPSE